jgi:hypothetical protein
MGEAAVLADLERSSQRFTESEHKWLAWEWVYARRLRREEEQSKALRDTARWTLAVAFCTFLVALFTLSLAWSEFHGKQRTSLQYQERGVMSVALPNPSLHPTCYSGLRPLPQAGELKR